MNNLRLSDQCKELRKAVADPEIPLVYGRVHRRYCVAVPYYDEILPSLAYPLELDLWLRNDAIYFCPWSGRPLPGDVFEIWCNIVEEEFGLDYSITEFNWNRLQTDMKSEAWWIARGIGPTNEVLRDGWIKPPPASKLIVTEVIDPPPGFRRMGRTAPHMCAKLAEKFCDDGVMIAYLPHTREYGFRVLEPGRAVDYQPIKIRPIRYCPWCGDALPAGLRTEWEARVAAANFTSDAMDFPLTPPAGFPADLAADDW